MLSTSILSYCNKLLDDDQHLIRIPENGSYPLSQRNAALGNYRVRYLGSVRSAKSSHPLKTGITSLQKPLIDLYSTVQRQFVYHRNFVLTPENSFTQTVNVCSYGVVVSENDPKLGGCGRGSTTSAASSDHEQPVVTKVITPLSNILLWAAVRFQSRLVSRSKQATGAAFVPLACNDAVLDKASFTKLTPKQRFLTRLSHPPLFVCVLRKVASPKVLECHMFMCGSPEEAVNLCSIMSNTQSQSSKVGALELPPLGTRMGCYTYSKSLHSASVTNSRSSPDSRTRSSDSELLPRHYRHHRSQAPSTSTTTSPNLSKESKRRYKKYHKGQASSRRSLYDSTGAPASVAQRAPLPSATSGAGLAANNNRSRFAGNLSTERRLHQIDDHVQAPIRLENQQQAQHYRSPGLRHNASELTAWKVPSSRLANASAANVARPPLSSQQQQSRGENNSRWTRKRDQEKCSDSVGQRQQIELPLPRRVPGSSKKAFEGDTAEANNGIGGINGNEPSRGNLQYSKGSKPIKVQPTAHHPDGCACDTCSSNKFNNFAKQPFVVERKSGPGGSAVAAIPIPPPLPSPATMYTVAGQPRRIWNKAVVINNEQQQQKQHLLPSLSSTSGPGREDHEHKQLSADHAAVVAFLSSNDHSTTTTQSESCPDTSSTEQAQKPHNHDHQQRGRVINYDLAKKTTKRPPVPTPRPLSPPLPPPRAVTRTKSTKRSGLLKRTLQRKQRSQQAKAKPLLFLPDADYSDSSVFDDEEEEGDSGHSEEPIEVNNYNGYVVAFDRSKANNSSARHPASQEPARETMILSKTVDFSSETDAGSVHSTHFLANYNNQISNQAGHRMQVYGLNSGGKSHGNLMPHRLPHKHANQAVSHHQLLKETGCELAAEQSEAQTEPFLHSSQLHPSEDQFDSNEISLIPGHEDVFLRNRYQFRSNLENLSHVKIQPTRKVKVGFLGRLRNSWHRFALFRRNKRRRPSTLVQGPSSDLYRRYGFPDRRSSWSFQETSNSGSGDSRKDIEAEEEEEDDEQPDRGVKADHDGGGGSGRRDVTMARSVVLVSGISESKSRQRAKSHVHDQNKLSHSSQSMDSGLEEAECLSSTELASSSQHSSGLPPPSRRPGARSAAIVALQQQLAARSGGKKGPQAPLPPATNTTSWSETNMGRELGYLP